MTSKKLIPNATRLRIVLVTLLCLLVAGTVGGGILGVNYLNSRAAEVQQVVFTASNSDEKLQRIQDLAKILDSNQEAVARAKQVVAESKSYQYQDVIIRDLHAMARRAGVEITNFNFSASGSATAPKSNGTSTPAPAKPTPSTGGLQSTTVDITLKTPVDYRKFLSFIHYLEQNLTKMQISKVGLAKANDPDNPDSVESEVLTIEVYIR